MATYSLTSVQLTLVQLSLIEGMIVLHNYFYPDLTILDSDHHLIFLALWLFIYFVNIRTMLRIAGEPPIKLVSEFCLCIVNSWIVDLTI